MAANLSRGWRGGSPAGRQASLCRGEDYKITSGSSKYHSVQNLSITFSSVSHKGKRLVCCDRINVSPELTSQNKTEEMEELKEKAVHQEGWGGSKEHDSSRSLGYPKRSGNSQAMHLPPDMDAYLDMCQGEFLISFPKTCSPASFPQLKTAVSEKLKNKKQLFHPFV